MSPFKDDGSADILFPAPVREKEGDAENEREEVPDDLGEDGQNAALQTQGKQTVSGGISSHKGECLKDEQDDAGSSHLPK